MHLTKGTIIKQRLEFIDVARSLAILLMLEGHFIIMSINPYFRDKNSIIYVYWQAIRTITAPLFFTVAGIIFTYLLLRNNDLNYFKNPRIFKGLKRGVMLIALGYLLHLNMYYILKGHYSGFFYSIHVLQCIGFSLISIVMIYGIYRILKKIPLTLLLAFAGFLCFIIVPTMKTLDLSNLHISVQHILLAKPEGSNFSSGFPIFPWMGFALFGGALGSILFFYPKVLDRKRNVIVLLGVIIYGTILTYEILKLINYAVIPLGFESVKSTGVQFIKLGEVIGVLILIYLMTKNRLKIKAFFQTYFYFLAKWLGIVIMAAIGGGILIWNHYSSIDNGAFFSLIDFGNILLFISLMIALFKLIPFNYPLFIKIGQHTLLIYVVHAIILYGSFVGYGLVYIIKQEFNPWQAVFFAALFLSFFVLLIKYRERIIDLFKRT